MNYLLKPLLTILAFVVATNSFAQERISSINGMDDDTPIVREWGNYKVISSSKCGHMNFSHFYLVQDSTNTVSIEEVDVNLINDFVVKGDYVFFCGNTTRNSVQSGIFGYFNLNQFPNAPITYLRISECTTFSKIATNGYNSNSMRVFLTGVDTAGHSRIVEALYTSYGGIIMPAWRVYTTKRQDVGGCQYVFDDLILVDTTLVVASRYMNPNSSAPASYGYVLYFGLNTVYPTPAVSHCIIKKMSIGDIVDPIILEKCNDSRFVVAFKSYSSSDNSYKSYLAFFNNITCYSLVRFAPPNSNYSFKDMAFDGVSNILDVLVAESWNSAIYNIDQSAVYSSSVVTCRIYHNYKLNSLCYLNNAANHFFSVGNNYNDVNSPYLIKYKYSAVGTCSETVSVLTQKTTLRIETGSLDNTYTDTYYIDASMSPTEITKFQYINHCISKD